MKMKNSNIEIPDELTAAAIALVISEDLNMTTEQQAYFVSGFQECIKYLSGAKLK